MSDGLQLLAPISFVQALQALEDISGPAVGEGDGTGDELVVGGGGGGILDVVVGCAALVVVGEAGVYDAK